MATNRPFAYNPTHISIDGTYNIGDLAVGITEQNYNTNPGGLIWWGGPDEEQGYVIAVPISGNTQPTPIFSGAPSGQLTLSPTYLGNSMNLSNGNQTVHQYFGYVQSVLGQTLINGNDKVMFSVFCSLIEPATLPNSHYIGIGTTSMNYNGVTPDPYNSYPGNDNQSIGLNSGGEYWYNGSIQSSGLPTWTSGDTIDVAVSLINNKIWIRVNGGNWNNSPTDNPATGTGGQGILGGLTSFYPVLCPSYEGTMTILNNATYGVPVGFTLLGSNINASVKFLGTKVYPNPFDDSTFIGLAEGYFNQSFTSATEASTWLTTNGYWNSYSVLSPVLSLDAGNPLSYPETGTVWTDMIGGKIFNIEVGSGTVNYSPSYGGCIAFSAVDGQYAECSTSLPDLSNWTLSVWHYYTGTETGGAPCIVTETFVGGGINYSLGNNNGGFSVGFFNGGWQVTDGYSLIPNNWYYIVGTYDGSTIKLYVNDTLVDSTNYTGTPTSSGAGIRLMERWDLANYWGGILATVDIYDVALNQSEITSKWNLTKSRFGL